MTKTPLSNLLNARSQSPEEALKQIPTQSLSALIIGEGSNDVANENAPIIYKVYAIYKHGNVEKIDFGQNYQSARNALQNFISENEFESHMQMINDYGDAFDCSWGTDSRRRDLCVGETTWEIKTGFIDPTAIIAIAGGDKIVLRNFGRLAVSKDHREGIETAFRDENPDSLIDINIEDADEFGRFLIHKDHLALLSGSTRPASSPNRLIQISISGVEDGFTMIDMIAPDSDRTAAEAMSEIAKTLAMKKIITDDRRIVFGDPDKTQIREYTQSGIVLAVNGNRFKFNSDQIQSINLDMQ